MARSVRGITWRPTKQGGEWALIVVSVFVFVAILANLRAFLNERRQNVRMR